MNIDQIYSNFIEYHEAQGRTFPCTESQFINRAMDYAREAYHQGWIETWYEEVADALCVKGIGPNWRND